jgi:hypothetical protein
LAAVINAVQADRLSTIVIAVAQQPESERDSALAPPAFLQQLGQYQSIFASTSPTPGGWGCEKIRGINPMHQLSPSISLPVPPQRHDRACLDQP